MCRPGRVRPPVRRRGGRPADPRPGRAAFPAGPGLIGSLLLGVPDEYGLRHAPAADSHPELFGVDLDADRVRDHLRHALGHGVGDASARITVFQPEPGSGVSVLVALRPAVGMPAMPQALQAVPYQRPLPHIKHVGTFGQIHYGRLAERHGFDDALLTGADGIVAEAAISNIGFLDDNRVVWPDAPALLGITMQLLDRRLAGSGVRSRRAPVRLADLPAYAGAFVTNSRGVAPVGRIDDLALPVGSGLLTTLSQLYEGVPWETP